VQRLPEEGDADAAADQRIGDGDNRQRDLRQAGLVGRLGQEQGRQPDRAQGIGDPGGQRGHGAVVSDVGEGLGQHGHDGVAETGGQAQRRGPAAAAGAQSDPEQQPDGGADRQPGDDPVRGVCQPGALFTRAGDDQENGQTGHHRNDGHPLAGAHGALRPPPGQGDGEQQRRGEQGLHHHQRAVAEGDDLQHETGDLGDHTQDPGRLLSHPDQQARPGCQFHRHLGRGSLLESDTGTEQGR
jgi:hypothetical protein